jgi:hypothetical protein
LTSFAMENHYVPGRFGSHVCGTDGAFCDVHFVLVGTSASSIVRFEEKSRRTFVKVPVLSEQITDTAPSDSTVFKDLHKILFCRIRLAVIVRLAVSAIGSPSGIKAMATLTQSTIKVGTLIQSG